MSDSNGFHSLNEMLGPDIIRQALESIALIVKKTVGNLKVALCGGVALQIYGSDRLTKDIDIVSNTDLDLPIENHLRIGGMVVRSPQGVAIDVIIREGEEAALYEEALETATEDASLPIPIVKPEYLAVMKYMAMRPKDELDLVWLLGSKIIDYAKVEALAKRLFGPVAERDFQSFKWEADLINERNRKADQLKFKSNGRGSR